MLRNIKINSRHYLLYPLVFLILLILISVVSIRLVLLNINNYKDEIESIISEHTGYSIDFHKIETKWKGWIPNLYLEDIKDLNDKQKEFIDFVLSKYVEGGVEELDINRLSDLIILKYKALQDGEKILGNPEGIKNMFVDFQKHLY